MPTDPFDSLREPNIPLAPRPAFAAELRRRVSVALGATRNTRQETLMPEVREYTPARLHSLTPYLATHDPAELETAAEQIIAIVKEQGRPE